MSQIIKPLTSSGPIPPIIPTSFTAQTGTAVPSENILLVNGYDSKENNLNGIATKGGVAAGDPPGGGAGNELDIYLTNRFTGVATTTDGTTTVQLVSNPAGSFPFDMGAVAGTYLFRNFIVAYNETDNISAAYAIEICVRTTGVAGITLNTGNNFITEEGAMSGVVITASTSTNSFILTAKGLAGKTINYSSLTEYTFVS